MPNHIKQIGKDQKQKAVCLRLDRETINLIDTRIKRLRIGRSKWLRGAIEMRLKKEE